MHRAGSLCRKSPRPFGIIGAVSRNGIIGINGSLPWNVPADRVSFEAVTRNKALVIGRKTLFEGPDNNFDHVAHCRRVVVVSRTLQEGDSDMTKVKESAALTPRPTFHFVSSFEAGLRLAQSTRQSKHVPSNPSANGIEGVTLTQWTDVDTWVGGGESIYRVALSMPDARFLHLTTLDLDVQTDKEDSIARFPEPHEWEPMYDLISRTEHGARDPVSFVTCIYERKRPL